MIDGGAELEIGWLPPLLQNARNPKIEVGKPGRVQASQGIRLMNVPTNVTRAAGDVHALGNPHFAVDPIIAKAIALHIAQAFSAVDPPNAAFYDANYKKFEATINAKLQEWGTKLLPFKGQSVVAYHDSWVYFAHRFGLNIDIFLEPKPGIPPSPSHLAEVIQQMKAQHIKAILVEPYHNRKIAEKVAESTGAKVVDFAQFPGALPEHRHLREIDGRAGGSAGRRAEMNYARREIFSGERTRLACCFWRPRRKLAFYKTDAFGEAPNATREGARAPRTRLSANSNYV